MKERNVQKEEGERGRKREKIRRRKKKLEERKFEE